MVGVAEFLGVVPAVYLGRWPTFRLVMGSCAHGNFICIVDDALPRRSGSSQWESGQPAKANATQPVSSAVCCFESAMLIHISLHSLGLASRLLPQARSTSVPCRRLPASMSLVTYKSDGARTPLRASVIQQKKHTR